MSNTITTNQAKEMIQRYLSNKQNILKSEYDSNMLSSSETFSASHVTSLLQQADCTSIRVFYGMSENLDIHAILVAADSNNNDIIDAVNPIIIEDGKRCPPLCPVSSPINP